MQTHASSCLEGPITASRAWWREVSPEVRIDAEPLFRAGLVAQIRQEIAAGTYDTEEKFEAAMDRLLDRLQRD